MRAFVTTAALLLAVAPAEAGTRTASIRAPVISGAPAMVVIPPPSAPSATSPLDASLPRPPLRGNEEAMDITTLSRSRVSWTFKVDHAWLGRLDEGARAGLLAACAADPRWRVVEEDGVLVAHRRTEDGAGWSVPRLGFQTEDDGEMWRVDLRFGRWPASGAWASSPHVAHVDAEARTLPVKAFVVPGTTALGDRVTAISVDGPAVGLDVYELGADDDRATTVSALLELATQVPTVAWTVASQLRKGEDVRVPGIDASGEPVPRLSLVDDQLDVRGWVNPGVAGWTFARIVGPEGAWEDAVVGAGTRERVGFSADATRTFWMQGRFPAPAGPAFAGTLELWVAPDDGSPVRQLGSWPVDVPARGVKLVQ